MNRFAAAALAALALVLAACGPAAPPLRLRHDAKRQLVYDLLLHEEAPHPVVGLGGTLEVGSTLRLACVSVERGGSAHHEVTVEHVRASAPAVTGAAVDTKLGRPVDGDRIGANAVVQALLPRRSMVVIDPAANVTGAQSDAEAGRHLVAWAKTQSVSARKVVFRLADALDAGPLAARWFGAVSTLLPPNERVPPGTSWRAAAPPIEMPVGRLDVALDVTYRKEGDVAVLTAKGTISPAGPPPDARPLDLDGAAIEMTARIDVARGVVLSYEESGSFDFRLRGAERLPAPWRFRRTMKLVETTDAPSGR